MFVDAKQPENYKVIGFSSIVLKMTELEGFSSVCS
jgi:hypothetical protein